MQRRAFLRIFAVFAPLRELRDELSIISVRHRTENLTTALINICHPLNRVTASRLPLVVSVTVEDKKAVEKKTAREFVVLN